MRGAAVCPRCDLCGAEIAPGERYYELPDGWTVCGGSDCLEDWAALYRRRRLALEEDEI